MNDYSVMGGVEKVTSTLITSFIKNGIPVWGIWSLYQKNLISSIPYPNDINIIVNNDINQVKKLLIKEKITTIVLQVSDLYLNYQLVKNISNMGIKVVSVVHGSPYNWLKRFYYKDIKAILSGIKFIFYSRNKAKKNFNGLIKYSDDILFVSKGACNEAKTIFKKYADKIEYVHNIVQVDKTLNIKQKENIIVFAGRLATEKRVFKTVKVLAPLFKKHLDWKYIILGSGEEEKKINNYLVKHEISNIILMGDVNNVDEFLAKSKVALLYSYTEGLPTFFIEAMNLKNILISFDSKGGVKDIVNDKNGFIIKKTSEMYKVVEEIMEHQDTYQKMLDNYPISESFSEAVIIKEWVRILSK